MSARADVRSRFATAAAGDLAELLCAVYVLLQVAAETDEQRELAERFSTELDRLPQLLDADLQWFEARATQLTQLNNRSAHLRAQLAESTRNLALARFQPAPAETARTLMDREYEEASARG